VAQFAKVSSSDGKWLYSCIHCWTWWQQLNMIWFKCISCLLNVPMLKLQTGLEVLGSWFLLQTICTQ
jgi:hypothetical protein